MNLLYPFSKKKRARDICLQKPARHPRPGMKLKEWRLRETKNVKNTRKGGLFKKGKFLLRLHTERGREAE